MWIIRISLDFYGDTFSPNRFLKDLNEPINVFLSNEPTDINESDPEGVYGFGCMNILSPQIYGLQYEMEDYENWYFDFLDKNKKLIDKHNVTKINLFIDVLHNGGQLNFEIFSREKLKKVGDYNIAIPISCYKLKTEEISKMLKEANFSKQKIKEFVNQF